MRRPVEQVVRILHCMCAHFSLERSSKPAAVRDEVRPTNREDGIGTSQLLTAGLQNYPACFSSTCNTAEHLPSYKHLGKLLGGR